MPVAISHNYELFAQKKSTRFCSFLTPFLYKYTIAMIPVKIREGKLATVRKGNEN